MIATDLAVIDYFLQQIDPLWQQVDARDQERWRRDRTVLDIAEAARQRRLNAAPAYYSNV